MSRIKLSDIKYGLLPRTKPLGKRFYVLSSSHSEFGDLANILNNDSDGDVRLFTTIDAAINACTADQGDEVVVLEGHTESITAASGIALDVDGVRVVGLGSGNSRPVVTMASTDNSATIAISGDDTRFENIVVVTNDDGLTNALNVTGDNCYIDIEHQDTSSAVEAAAAVRLDTANNCTLKLKHLGFTGGNATAALVVLDDCDNVRIDIDAFGVNSTSWVDMQDVASTNVFVTGQVYTQGVTDFSQNVTDTVTGSTWFAVLYDKSAGSHTIGSNVTAFADADVSSLTSLIGTIDSATTDNLHGKLGTDTELADRSIYDQLNGGGPATAATAAAPANDVSLYAALRYVSERQSPRIVSKAYADLTGYDDAAAFTVTGDVLVRVWGVVGGTAITSTSGTTTLSVGTTEDSDACLPATTIDNSDFAATDVWVDTNPEDDAGPVAATSQVVIGGGADINLVRSVDDITAGSLTLYCEFIPLSSDGNVVAA